MRRIAERYGVPVTRLIDFSANLNPDDPPAALVAALRAAVNDPRLIRDYPDMQLPELRAALAAYAGVASANIVVGNGFVPLLETALRVFAIRLCVLPVPCFVEYRRTLERAGTEVVAQRMQEENEFRLDAKSMLAAGADAMLLANPQNPSGVLTNRLELLALVQKAGQLGIKVLLDEAFIDYAPEYSLAHDVEQLPQLIVFRSVTKFFGVPGLRVAYAVAAGGVAQALENATAPWPVTTLAAVAVAAGLGDSEFACVSRERNARRRTELAQALEQIGMRSYRSAANFLLIPPVPGKDMRALRDRLITEHGIVVRDCDNYEGVSEGHVRVAVRGSADNELLVRALRTALDQGSSAMRTTRVSLRKPTKEHAKDNRGQAKFPCHRSSRIGSA